MIRNRANPGDQNHTKLNMISMVSNDIQTVNIPADKLNPQTPTPQALQVLSLQGFLRLTRMR